MAGVIRSAVRRTGGHRFGLCAESPGANVIGALAAAASGGSYVPIDPSWPEKRCRAVLSVADVRAVFSDGRSDLSWDSLPVRFIGEALDGVTDPAPDALAGAAERVKDTVPPDGGRGSELYVLFTSGSSGSPKAVPQYQNAVITYADNQERSLQLTPDDRLSMLTPFSYDMTAVDLYSALLSGAAVVPFDLQRRGLADLPATLREHRVTVLHAAPTVLGAILGVWQQQGGAFDHSIRLVLSGGEPLLSPLVHRLRSVLSDSITIVNGYGSTEASFSCHHRIEPGAPVADGVIPIGRPLAGFDVSIHPAASGAHAGTADAAVTDSSVGEMVVRTRWLTTGYLSGPGASPPDAAGERAHRFVEHPDGTRSFRTGDLGRWGDDGELVCLGRLDRQLKRRGVRIDPIEIELRLRAHPAVDRAAVILHPARRAVTSASGPHRHQVPPGSPTASELGDELVAVVSLRPGTPESPQRPADRDGAAPVDVRSDTRSDLGPAIAAHLAELLPRALLPDRLVVWDQLPLTVSGKIDLPAVERRMADPTARQRGAEPPLDSAASDRPTDPADRLATSLAARLGRAGVPGSVPFFELGAHSLMLAAVHAEVGRDLGLEFVDFFTYPTIDELAAVVLARSGLSAAPVVAAPEPVLTRIPAPALVPTAASWWQWEPEQTVAIVGMDGRFPGAPDVDAFWRLLMTGQDPITDLCTDDLIAAGTPQRLIDNPDLVRGIGELPEACRERLARLMIDSGPWGDPQHALFFDVVTSAVPSGGWASRLPAATGIHLAAGPNQHHLTQVLPALLAGDASWEELLPSGIGADHLAAQLAYRLGLTGPAVAYGAGCAAGLVAIGAAVTDLVDFRCDLAIAGAVHLTSPRHVRSADRTLSMDGRCRALSDDSDGSGMASGAAVVLLKRYADALQDGDRVLALIVGSAVNNDGRDRVGYQGPGVHGRQAVVAEAAASAGVPPRAVDHVELHASGTPWGDAIELAAVRAALEVDQRDPAGPLTVGALKSNIGNLDVAGGPAAVVKAALQLHHRTLVGNLHYRRPHPELPLADGRLSPVTATRAWPAPGDRPEWARLIGVNSFGAGGSNAHLLVAAAPPTEGVPA